MYPCKRVRRALDAVTALEPSLPVRNVGCAVRSRAPGFISSAAGACERAACVPLICVSWSMDVRGRGASVRVRCRLPPGGRSCTTGHGGGSARRRTRAARVSVPSRKTRDSPRHCSEPSAHSLTVYGSRPHGHGIAHGAWASPPPTSPPDRRRSPPQSESHVIHASKASNLEAELSKCIRPVWGSQATRTLH